MITQFRGEYSWLSNMEELSFPIIDDYGIRYYSTENMYQAAKSVNVKDREYIATLPPRKSKTEGRKLEVREDWEQVKIDVMRSALEQKFANDKYKKLLLDTGNVSIEEGNTWNDKFWGVCLKTGEGKNHLGNLIMQIRSNYHATSIMIDFITCEISADEKNEMLSAFKGVKPL